MIKNIECYTNMLRVIILCKLVFCLLLRQVTNKSSNTMWYESCRWSFNAQLSKKFDIFLKLLNYVKVYRLQQKIKKNFTKIFLSNVDRFQSSLTISKSLSLLSNECSRRQRCLHVPNPVAKDWTRMFVSFQPCEFYGPWSPWSDCSLTCNRGTYERTRTCVGGNVGDPGCSGPSNEIDFCNEHVCSAEWLVVLGVAWIVLLTVYLEQICPDWSEWRQWSDCPVSCGNGTQVRERVCVFDPQRPEDEIACPGESQEFQFCSTQVSNIYFQLASAYRTSSLFKNGFFNLLSNDTD